MRKPDPSLMSTHIDDPCPKCGATTRRVGMVIDPEAESFPMYEMCAVETCKHRFHQING